MFNELIVLGGFIRWLLKGCKTKLKDEVNGKFNATWGGTYRTENLIIGIITDIIILAFLTWCFA